MVVGAGRPDEEKQKAHLEMRTAARSGLSRGSRRTEGRSPAAGESERLSETVQEDEEEQRKGHRSPPRRKV